ETFECYQVDGRILPAAAGKNVSAFWQVDWMPLTQVEVDRGLKVMQWSREDLLGLTRHLSDEWLDREEPGEKWGIRGILNHLANSELWLLSRINSEVDTSSTLPEDCFRRLAATRNILDQIIRSMVDDPRVNGKDGSFWSPRKVLRRAAWHEVDHINHIFRLLSES
ncbi:MAG TPA: DinB family protein, partial [Leptolinea sp.]